MNIVQLVQDFESTENEMRSLAEGQLREAVKNDPAALILACSERLIQKDLTETLRHRVCSLMESTLLNSDTDQLWKSLNSEAKQQIKSNLVGTWTDPNQEIREITSNMISLIFAAEFESNGWPEILSSLSQTHQDPDIKKSAISTVGKICHHLEKQKITTLNKITAEQIFNVISQGMQENDTDESTLLSAVKALDASLTLMKEVFNEDTASEKTWRFLLSLAISNNRTIKICAFKCLEKYEVIGYNNETMKLFAETLWQATSTSIAEIDHDLLVSTIKIWDSLAQKEKQQEEEESKPEIRVASQAGDTLLPALLENLLEVCKSGDDDAAGLVSSTQDCLTSLARIMKDKFLQHSLIFVESHLMNQNNGELRASLITFSCMLNGPNRNTLSDIVPRAIPIILQIMMQNNNLVVQEAASYALFKAAEQLAPVFFKDPLFGQISEDLAAAINAHPKVSINIVNLWSKFGSYLKWMMKRNQMVSWDVTIVIDALIKNAFRDLDEEDEKLIDYTLAAAASLFLCISKEGVLKQRIRDLLQLLRKVHDLNGKRKELLQDGLMHCLEMVLEVCGFQIERETVDEIFKIIEDAIQSDYPGKALGLLHYIIPVSGSYFKPYFERSWLWIRQALSRIENPELFSLGLYATVSLVETYPEEMSVYLQDIFTVLIALLDKSDFDKTLKLRIIMTIGDISLGCKEWILPCAETLLNVYKVSMQAAVFNPQEKNSEMTEYLQQLRENLLDSYTSFFHGVSQTDNPDLILTSMAYLMEFLAVSCSQNYKPTRDYLRTSLTLIADIGLVFKDQVKQYMKSELTVYLLESLSKFSNDPECAEILDYAKKVLLQF